jgi:ribosome maturation factor RimP
MTALPSQATEAELSRLLQPVVLAQGFDLEQITISAAGRRSVIRIVIDSDDGVSLDAVAEVSRAVSAALDDHEPDDRRLRGAYVLEVSSPGVQRPLTEERHWRRAVGRVVSSRAAGASVSGRLRSVSDGRAVFDVDGDLREIPLDVLGPGHVEVEFAHADEPADPDEYANPLGADEYAQSDEFAHTDEFAQSDDDGEN